MALVVRHLSAPAASLARSASLAVLILVVFLPVAHAHTEPLPVVTLTIDMDEHSLTCTATLPTFAMRPLAGLGPDASREQRQARFDAVAQVLNGQCPIEVDGIQVMPVVSVIHLNDAFVDDPGGIPEEDNISGPLAKPWIDAHVQYSCSLKGRPKQIRMVWGIFPQQTALEAGIVEVEIDDLNEALARAEVFEDDRIVSFLPDEPEYVWYADHRKRAAPIAAVVIPPVEPLSLPVISMAAGMLMGALGLALMFRRLPRKPVLTAMIGLAVVVILARESGRVEFIPPWGQEAFVPREGDAEEIFTVLHRNIYRAFDYKAESDIYDALAHSVAGEMLQEVYTDMYRAVNDEDGAYCQIDTLTVMQSALTEARGSAYHDSVRFGMSCTWRVAGLVEHMGHVHRRINEYKGVYTLAAVGGRWKIVAVEIAEQERIVKKTAQQL